ncbi:MAG: UDP-N-acetylmuramate--L-alanine ligase [Candidatus Omnitrophota bacterium]
MEAVLSGVKHIYLVGIGGIGVGGLALLLKDKGFNVSGSDVHENYTIKLLRENGIEVFIGHCSEHMSADVDLVCYSSAIKQDNPEIQEAQRRGVTILPRGKLLGLLSWDKKAIAVSGSHGKTTTTSLIGYLMTSLGYEPTVFVGGLPLNYARHAWWGQDYFVIETDESDGSFLYYNPWVSIITNIDHEHLDYYRTIEDLQKSFLQFAYQTKGMVIGCGDEPTVMDIVQKAGGTLYGFGAHNKVSAANVTFDGNFTCFDLFVDHIYICPVSIPLLGTHNVLNTLAVISFFLYMGEDVAKVVNLLKGFKGTKRRFQVKKKLNDVIFVDDYAHHPTEIAAVLNAARYLRPKRLFVIFQPHRFSRVEALYKEFARCFGAVDELIVTDIYAASEKPIAGVDAHFLLEEIKKYFRGNIQHVAKEELVDIIPPRLEPGDLVMGLGAGDINTIMDGIVNEFERSRVKA